MTFTIEFGWWLAPLAVTLATFIAATWMNRDICGGGDYSFSGFWAGINYLIFWIIPSLIAWLVWALLR